MSSHLIQAVLFSLWAVLILRMFRRAQRLHHLQALKKRKAKALHRLESDEPMAIRVQTLRH